MIWRKWGRMEENRRGCGSFDVEMKVRPREERKEKEWKEFGDGR